MTGIAAVTAWPIEQLGAAALTISAHADRTLSATQAAQKAMGSDPAWTGSTHTAAGSAIATVTSRGTRLVRTLDDVAERATSAGGQLASTRASLLQKVNSATLAGFTVGDDGTVTHSNPRRRQDAQYLQDGITQFLKAVNDADRRFAGELSKLAGLLTGDGSTLPNPGHGATSPKGVIAELKKMKPDQIRNYWNTLSPQEANALIDENPWVVGNLDGVPFSDRIAANDLGIRTTLLMEKQKNPNSTRVKTLEQMLEPADDGSGTKKPRQFIAFENTERGHYVELVGSLEPGVKGVAVMVPGTGSNLDNNGTMRKRAVNLSKASGSPVLVYADSDLPQQVTNEAKLDGKDAALLPLLLNPFTAPGTLVTGARIELDDITRGSASDPVYAKAMAPQLVQFGNELDAEVAAHAPGTRTTFIGHSYGGSVVGTAEQAGLRADNVVYASSAGTGAGDGPWRNPAHDLHRYSLTAPGDPIDFAQRLGTRVHGGDPDTTPGVQRLDTGYLSPHDGKPGALVAGQSGHSSYLDDPGSTGFGNIAKIVSGDGQPTPYVNRAPDAVDAAAAAAAHKASEIELMGRIIGENVLKLLSPALGR